jgi:hypothetical protein
MPPIGAAFPKSRDPEHGFDPAVGDARRTGRMPAVPSATHVNSTYVENMRRLWRLDARLAQRIDEVPPDDLLAVEASRAGPPTAAVVTGDGRRLYLHSRYDPQREAMDFCATLETRDAACIVLSGLGLGHHLRALHDEYGSGSTFLISEPDTATIATAFRHTDLTAVLDSGRIEFITRLDKSYLHERIGRFATVLMLGTQFVVPPVSLQVGADFHQACREAILAFAAYAKMSLVTLVKNAGITCGNVADNLPTYVSTPSLDVLRRRFEGAPAILVAAGPSLGRHLDRLRGLDQRAVVVTAQTTLRLLLGHGVHPHFVTALDYSSVSKQFFENLDIPDDLVLVAEPKASCAVIDAFERRDDAHPGRTILLDNVFARRCVGETLGKRAALEPGATVMHLAFYLAEWMGCDPIILVGQDLGFSGHVYYTPGVTMHRSWDPELGRFGTLEMKEWERIVRHRPILRKILDIHGREIYTDEQMYTYLQQFERDIGRSRCRDRCDRGWCADRGVGIDDARRSDRSILHATDRRVAIRLSAVELAAARPARPGARRGPTAAVGAGRVSPALRGNAPTARRHEIADRPSGRIQSTTGAGGRPSHARATTGYDLPDGPRGVPTGRIAEDRRRPANGNDEKRRRGPGPATIGPRHAIHRRPVGWMRPARRDPRRRAEPL